MQTDRSNWRWYIAVMLVPALIIYIVVFLLPLIETLRLSIYRTTSAGGINFVGGNNYVSLFLDPTWSGPFWNAFRNNVWFFVVNMVVQNPLGLLIAALLAVPRRRGRTFYRTVIFLPAMLSFVVVGFSWRLILSPTWNVIGAILHPLGLSHLIRPWLGLPDTALTTIALISCWQSIGIPMLLFYAALIAIPEELDEAAACDGLVGIKRFFKIKLPLIWPTVGVVTMLTFAGNFNTFDLVYVMEGTLAGPNFSTDLLSTFLYRTFFGNELQIGDPYMGAAIATVMILLILCGIGAYMFAIQRRLIRYQM